MQLEKELDREEREAMERFIQTEEGKKLEKMGPMTTELAGKLQGKILIRVQPFNFKGGVWVFF